MAKFQRFENEKQNHSNTNKIKIDCHACCYIFKKIKFICPVTKAIRKFGGKGGAARDLGETGPRIRRSKLVSSVRSNIMRRRLANRNRDAVRRAKLMRRYFHI